MRITIDTETKDIIVPNSFFDNIDKMNKTLTENGVEAIKYDTYVAKQLDEAKLKMHIIRQSDLKKVK